MMFARNIYVIIFTGQHKRLISRTIVSKITEAKCVAMNREEYRNCSPSLLTLPVSNYALSDLRIYIFIIRADDVTMMFGDI